MWPFQYKKTIFCCGVHIDAHQLHWLQLQRKHQQWHIHHTAHLSLNTKHDYHTALKHLYQQQRPVCGPIYLSLAQSYLQYQDIAFPKRLSPKALRQWLCWQAAQLFPQPLKNYQYDYEWLGEKAHCTLRLIALEKTKIATLSQILPLKLITLDILAIPFLIPHPPTDFYALYIKQSDQAFFLVCQHHKVHYWHLMPSLENESIHTQIQHQETIFQTMQPQHRIQHHYQITTPPTHLPNYQPLPLYTNLENFNLLKDGLSFALARQGWPHVN